MKLRNIMPAAVAGLLLASPASADMAAVNAVIGKTWNFVQGSVSGKVSYTENSISATFLGKTYTGSLRLNGEEICVKYEDLNNGKEECFGVSQQGNSYVTTNGTTLTP